MAVFGRLANGALAGLTGADGDGIVVLGGVEDGEFFDFGGEFGFGKGGDAPDGVIGAGEGVEFGGAELDGAAFVDDVGVDAGVGFG